MWIFFLIRCSFERVTSAFRTRRSALDAVKCREEVWLPRTVAYYAWAISIEERTSPSLNHGEPLLGFDVARWRTIADRS
jgi:hypothetical protein